MPDLEGSWWEPALHGTPVLRAAAEAGSRRATDPAAGYHRDGLAVPIPTNQADHAVLLVVDRTFEQETFGTVDLSLLETLAGHAAVTLDNARLVDRLRRFAEQRQHEATMTC